MTEETFNPLSGALLLGGGYRDAISSQLRAAGVGTRDSEALATELAAQCKVYLSLNPRYEAGTVDFRTWANNHGLHSAFQDTERFGISSLYKHQEEAVLAIQQGRHTLITAGTGSGKTECFTIPILDWCLKHAPGAGGIQAIFIYPMNALAGDQTRRLGTALKNTSLKYGIYVGSTPQSETTISPTERGERDPARLYTRSEMQQHPSDLLLTNHVQLDWMLTGDAGRKMLQKSSSTLRFVVVDELHTFRGARAAHLKYLLRRLRDATGGVAPVMIGASATLGDDRAAIEQFGSTVFDVPVHVIRADGEPNALPRRPDPPASPVAGDTGSELARRGWLHAISDILVDRNGIAPYGEVLDALQSRLPDPSPIGPDDLLLQCLQASVSGQVEDRLDFRVHVFIPRVRHTIRRCCQCKRLITSPSVACPVCEVPAFPVAKADASAVLGVACRGRLMPFEPLGSLPADGVPVLAHFESIPDVPRGPILRFRPTEPTSDSMAILFDPSGPLTLELVPEEMLRENVLRLDHGTWSDAAEVFRQMLLNRPRGKRRLLAFQDNREKVSRTASEARDCFASAVFRDLVGRNRERLCGSTLSGTIAYLGGICRDLKKKAGSPLEARLWDEFPFWLRRELTASGSGAVRLQLAGEETDTAKCRVLDVFLAERAIAELPPVPELASLHHVWFFRHAAARQRAIHIEPRSNGDLKISVISLGPDACKHRQLVKDLGPETVRKCIEELHACGWLERIESAGTAPLYVLRPRYVRLTVALDSTPNAGTKITDNWLRAAMHSAELNADQRRATEEAFRGGDLDFVIATPTLEMGIDIGHLDQAVMIGAPPLPSNYAQRAGRAGRKRGSREALIACLCSPKSDHDVMAFEDPTSMIAGRITPPQFEHNSRVVATRHLHAWVASGHDIVDSAVISRASVLFSDAFDVDRYLARDYVTARADALSRHPVGLDQRKWFYESGFFPDYGFNRDQVQVCDAEVGRPRCDNSPSEEFGSSRPKCVSERDRDQAFIKFCPGRILPAGGAYWLLDTPVEKDAYVLLADRHTPEVRQYEWLVAHAEGFDVSNDLKDPVYASSVEFADNPAFQPLTPSFALAHLPECRLKFINRGEVEPESREVTPFRDPDGREFRLGYELTRQVLLFRFPRDLYGDGRQPLSLIAAAVRAMKDVYGIGDDEIRVAGEVRPAGSDEAGPYRHVALYDADGNGSLPLARVYEGFDQIVRQALQNVESCSHCKHGCLLCLRSFYCRFRKVRVTRRDAADFARYLLGQRRLKPYLERTTRVISSPSYLRVQWRSPRLRFGSGRFEDAVEKAGQIYTAIAGEIVRMPKPECLSLEIVLDGVDWLVDVLNGTKAADKDIDEFRTLLFQLLRYQTVSAAKRHWL
jgi:hypothetical protein